MKNRIGISFLFCLIFSSALIAQNLSVSPTQLNFGIKTELTPDSQQVTISNASGNDITVTGYRFYAKYGSNPFSTSAGNITIPDGGSQAIWIKFDVRHNVYHNSELFILNDGHKGALRVDLLGQGRYSNTYYSHTENLIEQVLKDTLKAVISRNYDTLGYNIGRDSMFMWFDNKKFNGQGATQNTIECVYTGRQAIGYIDRSDCQNLATYSFNTEHTFPQGFFSSIEPMRSDLYHLFPTDDDANNKRGSLPFGVVTNPTWQNGGSKVNSTTFEPRDIQKGRSARAMFYFVLRYQNYNNFLTNQEGILRQWHNQFAVDNIEIKRGNDIASIQDNRNPFIDYPQFTERITSISSTSVGNTNASADMPEDTIDFGLINATLANQYTFWLANDGFAPFTASNFNFNSATVLNFINGTGVNTTVQPGEAIPVEIVLAMAAPNPNFVGTLNFNVQGAGLLANVSVPIRANLSMTGIGDLTNGNAYRLYPNPAQDILCVDGLMAETKNIKVIDVLGRVRSVSSTSPNHCISISDLQEDGFYILQWEEHGVVYRKSWIKN
jgi:Endonuclease I/Secretion system C-terminal sorting domain